jgi:hypothetical protein
MSRRTGAEALRLYLLAFIDPFGTLWFIYLLPVFFLATRLTRSDCRRSLSSLRSAVAERSYRNRLDPDRRIRRTLRVFLCGLSVRPMDRDACRMVSRSPAS